MRTYSARKAYSDPIQTLKVQFSSILTDPGSCDAIFRDVSFQQVVGVAGLLYNAPVMQMLFARNDIARYLHSFEKNCSLLINFGLEQVKLYLRQDDDIGELEIPPHLKGQVVRILESVPQWAGILNSNGQHVIDLRYPSPGPHYSVNLLLGNRNGFRDPLQTTPKSVADRMGRGSFRSHAATQVLATRWDLRAEENGFPANRQFYILEDDEVIFYSANSDDTNIISARCIHSQNVTQIQYHTVCGLIIKRIIFILPQKKGFPLAVESHRIEITSCQQKKRRLKLVYTGMFGTAATHAIWEDVLYSNLIMQANILRDKDNNLIAIGNEYYPVEFQKDLRFHSTIVHTSQGMRFPNQFCFDYNQFVGGGTLEKPDNASQLSNQLSRKGPGFFAVGMDLEFERAQTVKIDNFTGLISSPPDQTPSPEEYKREIVALLLAHKDPEQTEYDLAEVRYFVEKYSQYIQIKSDKAEFDAYFNRNLPFQVLYQTYVSRSFGQTQKGYRQIGFREIQDIYASMYYFISMGEHVLVKELLGHWIKNVYEFGYTNHNFFWTGMEPGKWSDDGLWLIPAVYRYINISGDDSILDQEFEIAGSDPKTKRRLLDTLFAIIAYSGRISIGRHRLPLIDSADWNDCLKVDKDFLTGPDKERLYNQLASQSHSFDDMHQNDFSESTMNAFLLKHGLDLMAVLLKKREDKERLKEIHDLSEELCNNIQTHAWKGEYFARVLLNRPQNKEFSFIGAAGDGFAQDKTIPGVYFLNSFSWAILSDCATQEQIETMVAVIEKYLKTPYGLKLMTPAALERISTNTATGHYFSGDRENGAVFKHAAMMAVAALIKACKEVESGLLARKMAAMAYQMIDLTLPYMTLADPFKLGGNPRFCTQYINSETGEHIGPLLSGTSTWLLLSLLSAYSGDISISGFFLDPILKESQKQLDIFLNTGQASYKIHIRKPLGFFRILDSTYSVKLDQEKLEDNHIPFFTDKKQHQVEISFLSRK